MSGQSTRRAAMTAGLAFAMAPGMARSTPSSRQLSNPNASAEARALYTLLWRFYGRKTLTGQQEGVARPDVELDYIEKATGRLPAILGLDYIEPRLNAGVNDRA